MSEVDPGAKETIVLIHGHSPIADEGQFHYAFANTLSQDESDAIRTRYDVPAARTVLFEGVLANLHRHPSTARHNYEKYEKSDSIRAFKEFPDRPHFPAAPGWEEVADYALAWALDPVSGDSLEVAGTAR